MESARLLYSALFPSILLYGIMFWGNSLHAISIFKLQERAIKIMKQVSRNTSCRQLFKTLYLLPLLCMFVHETLMFVKYNSQVYTKKSFVHSCNNTRNKEDLFVIPVKP
ncbi:hypothetical protein R5R35_013231 [Gryllus longicercus]|uniref:Uncharacterized protein n=1 Tax=Gryllus longicercus TaxID=2509291 RepID=A0AAN9W710_9ORTH